MTKEEYKAKKLEEFKKEFNDVFSDSGYIESGSINNEWRLDDALAFLSQTIDEAYDLGYDECYDIEITSQDPSC